MPDIIVNKNFRRILIDHSQRYPKWAVEDLYKLIYQAAMGCEHAVQDKEKAQEWLKVEMENLVPGIAESMVDILSPDNQIARIHLRPFLAAGSGNQVLMDAFMQTAECFKGSKEKLIMYGQYAATMAANETFSFTKKEIAKFFQSMEESRYPAIHHSSTFNAEYCPAYRVIAIKYLPQEILSR
jgi:hypothetical protein